MSKIRRFFFIMQLFGDFLLTVMFSKTKNRVEVG